MIVGGQGREHSSRPGHVQQESDADSTDLIARRELGRRAFLTLGASRSLLLLGLLFAPTGCDEKSHVSDDERFSDAIRALYPDPDVAAPIARASGLSEREALAILTRGAPDVLTSAGQTVSFLDQRVRKDFIDGRIVMIDRWTLSQTEAAIAVVVAGPSRGL